MKNSIPSSHGATAVAQASFGTVIIVGFLLFIGALWTQQDLPVYLSLAAGICGAIFGYFLWQKQQYVIATSINAGGLLLSGLIVYICTAQLTGPTGILLLASVITAGGLLGRKGAIVDIIIAFLIIILGYFFGNDIRQWLQIDVTGYEVEESLMLIFIVSSLPSWGAYVVAIDASNRQAWQKYYISNQKLLEQQKAITRAKKQQEEVANLGLLATGDASLQSLEQRCWQIIQNNFPQAKREWEYLTENGGLSEDSISKIDVKDTSQQLFLSSLTQVLRARNLRESILLERATLANRIQREERLESLSRMAGGVAHDFNNALSLVVSIADECASDPSLPPHVIAGTETILEATRHASELTKQLLLFSKGIPVENTPIKAADILYETLPILKRVLHNKGELLIDVQQSNHFINMRKENLQRIFFNLVQNAAESLREDGWVRITIEPSREQLTISVIDNGEGMDASTKEKAIEPYFSGKEQTGLGLSTVHGLVEQVGGNLRIQSVKDIGSTITITIPTQEYPKSNIQNNSHSTSKEKCVLLIDDEPFVRMAIEMFLRRLGWVVYCAGTRAEAMDYIDNPISLIVCDIRLVDDTGYDVVQALNEEGLHAPVLYVTGYAGIQNTNTMQNTHLLIKPFRLHDLEKALKIVLEKDVNIPQKIS